MFIKQLFSIGYKIQFFLNTNILRLEFIYSQSGELNKSILEEESSTRTRTHAPKVALKFKSLNK